MDEITATLLAVGLVFVLLAVGVPVFASLALAGVAGIAMVEDLNFALLRLKSFSYTQTAVYMLAVIPLFILMGNFAQKAGVGQRLFGVARKWVGRLPGGLAIASVLTSAGFAATSGSSVATAATVGSVAIPEMKAAGYDRRLSTGVVAAGGVLGVLIPPSVLLIFYASLTEVSAGAMLVAGVLPGLLSTLVFVLGIMVVSRRIMPAGAQRAPSYGWGERLRSLADAWQVLILFIVVLGGIYLGLVTPTEAGAVGAFVAFVMLLFSRQARPKLGARLKESFRSSINTTVMILMTMLGAGIFSYFLTLVGTPQAIVETVTALDLPPLLVIGVLLLIYLPLGMFLDAFSMLVITMPILFPTVHSLGFDPLWFGILAVKMCEIGLITPPVGLNVYVTAGIDKDTPLVDVFRGASWFLVMEAVTTLLIFFFPIIVTWLPAQMR
ncbi:TRAP transporter large permease [Alloalcanivorax mobilis]|uniref:TRAP transporter large permease n=1 Tax=Alloalcanivorax mobilis TaxID=2019569 RepID=UPI000B5B3E6F|nr:TRAP transporter large permease [Alloalcanivorax mobilis]ASK35466.1 C4-dicarboxylate ABC transporter permease [Alcanivorax sp. N3-2A]|tara:strand:+ start:19027 stop:20340 length:1314 start_codon:yes stop_codon:yes gene_type:complete